MCEILFAPGAMLGPRNLTQVFSLGSKCLYPLSHLTIPTVNSFSLYKIKEVIR